MNECDDENEEEACPDSSSTCVDIPGSYDCECQEGYELNDEDQCSGM